MKNITRVALITSGGDCQGLNAAMRGIGKALHNRIENLEIFGMYDGYRGLIDGDYKYMEPKDFAGILTQGGTILGTTTAGDTAASTAPMTAASILLIFRIMGANITKASNSQVAGTQDSMTAERPTFFRSFRSRDSPALRSIMISAICRSCDEIFRIDTSNRFSTYGPRIIPVNNIPIMRGR